MELNKGWSEKIIRRVNEVITQWMAANCDPATGQGRFVFRIRQQGQ